MKIKLKLGVSESTKTEIVTLDELGYSLLDWEELTEEEKHSSLVEFIDSLPDQPYWYLETSETI